ncbi:MAG TPA: polymer-forming cytoskeletal protein [Casimicrobiaceae bacterium]|nr:polymer-forming cytoskeletal protein [Casimicrobiaceae bacterium]
MFERRKPAPPKRIDSLIGAGTVVRGDVLFAGGLRIDGKVEGNVATAEGQTGTLVISEQARIDGRVSVSHVVVNGTVKGPIVARDYLELQGKARIDGDVTYRTLEMQVGAVVEGRLDHAEPGTAAVVELKRAAAD